MLHIDDVELIRLQDGLRTAGILVKEGATGGNEPLIQVLEIGTISSKRHPSDILPFLPRFQQFFQPLPSNSDQMHLKVCKISLADLELVTNTVVKSSGPIWYLNIKKGTPPDIESMLSERITSAHWFRTEALRLGDKELSKYTKSWLNPAWEEIDWSRLKELQVRDILDKRQAEAQIAQSCRCIECPDFVKHVSEGICLVRWSLLTLKTSSRCNMTSGKSRNLSRN